MMVIIVVILDVLLIRVVISIRSISIYLLTLFIYWFTEAFYYVLKVL